MFVKVVSLKVDVKSYTSYYSYTFKGDNLPLESRRLLVTGIETKFERVANEIKFDAKSYNIKNNVDINE